MSANPAQATAPTDTQSLSEFIKSENAREKREARGEYVPEPADVVAPADKQPPATAPAVETADPVDDRNADGTFKAKAPVAKPDDGGDPRESVQAKINRERRLRGEAERERDALKAQLAAPKPSTPASPAPVVTPAKAKSYADELRAYQADPNFPKIDDYADFDDPYGALRDATAAFVADKRLEAKDQQQQVERAKTEAQQRQQAALDAGAEKYTDWDDLLASETAKIDLPGTVLRELYDYDSTLSADMIHHLLTHPETMAVLAKIDSPIAAARAVGALSVEVARTPAQDSAHSGPDPAPRPVTKAKPLIKPVSASPAAPEALSPDELPFGRKYIEQMNARERKQREERRGA